MSIVHVEEHLNEIGKQAQDAGELLKVARERLAGADTSKADHLMNAMVSRLANIIAIVTQVRYQLSERDPRDAAIQSAVEYLSASQTDEGRPGWSRAELQHIIDILEGKSGASDRPAETDGSDKGPEAQSEANGSNDDLTSLRNQMARALFDIQHQASRHHRAVADEEWLLHDLHVIEQIAEVAIGKLVEEERS